MSIVSDKGTFVFYIQIFYIKGRHVVTVNVAEMFEFGNKWKWVGYSIFISWKWS